MNKKYGSNVPLVLMNSFNTQADTERIRFKYERRVDLHMFQQSYYPRVLKETLRPFPENFDLNDGWYVAWLIEVYKCNNRSIIMTSSLPDHCLEIRCLVLL